MPRYIIERNVGDVDFAELEAASRRSLEVLDTMEGIVWIKSYVSEAEGKVFCEYDAPSPEAIREHARRAGLPADNISEIKMEISPDMFR
jgi:Nickel responsive protein SCO4226-like